MHVMLNNRSLARAVSDGSACLKAGSREIPHGGYQYAIGARINAVLRSELAAAKPFA
jgi:hypothetical protein